MHSHEGLHSDIIYHLRRMKILGKIIYVRIHAAMQSKPFQVIKT